MAVFVIAATALSLVFYIPILSAPKAMLGMFIADNPAAVEMGAGMLRLYFSAYVTYGFVIMSITLFQALGKASRASVITLLRSVILFIPLVLVLPGMNGLGVHGLFLAQVVTDIIVLAITILLVLAALRKLKAGKEV